MLMPSVAVASKERGPAEAAPRCSCVVVACLMPSPAAAEIIRLSGGRTLSVKAHRDEGESIVLTLRAGGEIVCPRSMVAEILPDEVPYPEPPAEPAERPAAGRVRGHRRTVP